MVTVSWVRSDRLFDSFLAPLRCLVVIFVVFDVFTMFCGLGPVLFRAAKKKKKKPKQNQNQNKTRLTHRGLLL